MKIKRKISIFLKQTFFFKYLVVINMFVFHFHKRKHKVKYGNKNKNITFYVIRPNGNQEGLLSCCLSVLKHYNFALKNEYEAIIDYENYDNQYTLGNINDTDNSWEYFFENISKYSLKDVYESKNVILSGWTVADILKNKEYDSFEKEVKFYKKLFYKIKIQNHIMKLADKIENENINCNTLGIYIRGTDYVALKPKNHFIQPNIESVIDKIKEFEVKYKISNIFLVTEDSKIENKIKEKVKINIFCISQISLDNYDGKDYLTSYFSKDDLYKNTLNYLIKIILLSRCNYLISSITSATIFLHCLKKDEYKEEFIFDLGRY